MRRRVRVLCGRTDCHLLACLPVLALRLTTFWYIYIRFTFQTFNSKQLASIKAYGTGNDKTQLIGPKKHHVAGFTRTEIAIDVLSLMFAEVQHMGALTAIYCHSEEKGLGMSLASKLNE